MPYRLIPPQVLVAAARLSPQWHHDHGPDERQRREHTHNHATAAVIHRAVTAVAIVAGPPAVVRVARIATTAVSIVWREYRRDVLTDIRLAHVRAALRARAGGVIQKMIGTALVGVREDVAVLTVVV